MDVNFEEIGEQNAENILLVSPQETGRLVVAQDFNGENKDWLVLDFIPATSFGQLVALTNTGKTFVAIDLALHIVRGLLGDLWLDRFEIDRRGDVVYCFMEGIFDVDKRIRAWEVGHPERPWGAHKLWLLPEKPLDISNLDSIANLATDIKLAGARPALIVIDTRALATQTVDENSNEEFGAVAGKMKNLAQNFKCAVLLVHHTPAKDTTRSRGATAVTAAADFEFAIDKGKLVCNKSKYAKAFAPIPFELVTVSLNSVDSHGRKQHNNYVRTKSETNKPADFAEKLRKFAEKCAAEDPPKTDFAKATLKVVLGINGQRAGEIIEQYGDEGTLLTRIKTGKTASGKDIYRYQINTAPG